MVEMSMEAKESLKNQTVHVVCLENRVPTWDILQKRNFQGPGWCVLCKKELESISHLFITCPFSIAVWKESMSLVGLDYRWDGNSVNNAWENWWRHVSLKH